MTVLFITMIPLFLMIAGHFMYPNRITLPEIIAGALVSLVLSFGMYQVGRYAEMADTELWNGEITGTTKVLDEYNRPYSCNCRTTKIGNTTSTTCQTCYDTGTDMFWDAQSNIGSFRIDHVDCSSTRESTCLARHPDPQRWADIRKGDPVSKTNSYLNYVKAANFGLFNSGEPVQGEQSKAPDLDYPITVYDHYRVDRVLTDGIDIPGGAAAWNAELSEILKTLGPEKQANMVVVLTDAGNPSYGEMLLTQWQGAKKNDIVIVAGFPRGSMADGPEWVFIHSWAKFDIFNVTLRDALLDNPDWWGSADAFFPEVQQVVLDHFERRPMEEFEYLANEIEPSTGAVIFMAIMSIMAAGGMLYAFHEHDLFGHSNSHSSFRRYRR
jgi:hypothetical protein